MSYFKLIQCCFFFVIILACKKQNKYTATAQGRIIEGATGNPIEGAKVTLQDGVGNSGPINLGSTSSGIKLETYTNANGEFSLKIEGEYIPYLSTGKAKYHDFRYDGTGVMPLKNGINNNTTLALESETYFDPIFKNIQPNSVFDTLWVELLYFKDKSLRSKRFKEGGGMGDINNSPYLGFGPHRFLSNNLEKEGLYYQGNRFHPFRLIVFRSNKWETILDSVFVPAFVNFKDTIYY